MKVPRPVLYIRDSNFSLICVCYSDQTIWWSERLLPATVIFKKQVGKRAPCSQSETLKEPAADKRTAGVSHLQPSYNCLNVMEDKAEGKIFQKGSKWFRNMYWFLFTPDNM